ncbi:DUF222 domain-containing protein [Agrococcus sp. Ld7]|uniref:HNH endonuclease signature motif containing protein n=1 Tax=Agrococcus sp. Ld7 TaxID=649148 RepID=UPI0038667DA3
MDEAFIDAESYIAAIRAGAIDPFGGSADELTAALDESLRAESELMASLSDAEIDDFFRTGTTPCLPAPPEPPVLQRLRLDAEFAGRLKSLAQQAARIEGERRTLLAEHMQRALDEQNAATAVRELASIAAVELRQSPRGVERAMTDAWRLVRELPLTHEAAKAGRIATGHLRVIEQETRALRADDGIDTEQRAAVEAQLVDIATTATPGALARRAKRIVDRMLPTPLQQRFDDAFAQRKVEVLNPRDGMSDLYARIPTVLAAGIMDRATQAARGKSKDDPRTFDQFRADAFSELLLGGVVPEDLHGTAMLTAHVSVLIPATELLHDKDTPDQPFPASLDGTVLVDGDTARRLAAGERMWERLFTDPVTGVAVTVDTYRASADQRRWLQARDGGCRAPNCGCRGTIGDLDHTLDWAKGGTTSIDNLAVLCRRDHTLKHASRWSMRQLDHGVIEWTTPLGDVVTTVPEAVGPTFADLDPPPAEPKLAEPPPVDPEPTAPPPAEPEPPLAEPPRSELLPSEPTPAAWGDTHPGSGDRQARGMPF